MPQTRKGMTRPPMKRKKQKGSSGSPLKKIIIGFGVLLFMYYVVTGAMRLFSSPASIPATERAYSDSGLRVIPMVKRLRLDKTSPNYKEQDSLLYEMESIRQLIPWESKYQYIYEAQIKQNSDLVAYRLELIEKFQPMIDKLQEAIDDPSKQTFIELLDFIKSSRSLIDDTIRETKSKSEVFGGNNADIIINALEELKDFQPRPAARELLKQ